MKQNFLFTLLLLQCFLGFAQAPNKMSYQAVIRNSNNTVVSNHAVGMRISILQGTATGTAVYTETQTPTTNANGLIAIEIGTGTVVSGTFANIDWANGPYFVKTETDPNGGTAYTLTSSNQLLSVPYALYAKTAGNGISIPNGGQSGQSLTLCDGQLIWGSCTGKINSLFYTDSIQLETLNISNDGADVTLNYTGGNGGVYQNQSVNSTGVLGLIATFNPGNFNNGNGSLIVNIKGTPKTTGIASFSINLGGKSCILRKVIKNGYSKNYVHCNNIKTEVVEVTNPITGRIWMDRNLGALRAATGIYDTSAFGDLYQWGRGPDGHQCRNSGTQQTIKSLTDQPGHNLFIISPYYNNNQYNTNDWREPQNNNLWQGVNGINNPCPIGFLVPTLSEFIEENNTWSQSNQTGAYNSNLKLIFAGRRDGLAATPSGFIYLGLASYWTSSVYVDKLYFSPVTTSNYFYFDTNQSSKSVEARHFGMSVRCIKD